MQAVISSQLHAYLQKIGSRVLTVSLLPVRCWSGTLYNVSVDTTSPKDASHYAFFEQDGLRIYYTPKLERKTDILELGYVRVLFHSRPLMTGPEELLATIIIGRF